MTMNKKIASFGDSFIFGWEIPNNFSGDRNWPQFAADHIGVEHVCCSSPGVGNDIIATQVYNYYNNTKNHSDLAVINWTWTLRWDYYIYFKDWLTWTTFGPNKHSNPFRDGLSLNSKIKNERDKEGRWIPSALKKLDPAIVTNSKKMYDDLIVDNQEYNKFRALQTISSCNNFMNRYNIKSVQTYMDHEIFEKEWHCPEYIKSLQSLIVDDMRLFDGMNFLEWSRHNNFKITEPDWHPLEDAHRAAAEFWLPTYKELLRDD